MIEQALQYRHNIDLGRNDGLLYRPLKNATYYSVLYPTMIAKSKNTLVKINIFSAELHIFKKNYLRMMNKYSRNTLLLILYK